MGVAIAMLKFASHRKIPSKDTVSNETNAVLGALLVSTATVALAQFVAQARATPHGLWDAWAVWNMKARLFARAPALWKLTIEQLENTDYPLLLPAIIGRLFRGLHSESTVIPRGVALGFAFAAVLVVGGGIATTRSRTLGCIAAWAVFTGPIEAYATFQYADVPLAFFFAAAVALIAVADLEDERRASLLAAAGVFAGFAVLTKNEGTLFLVGLLLTRVVRYPRRSQFLQLAREIGYVAAGSGPALVLSAWHRHLARTNQLIGGDGHSMGQKLTSLPRYATVWATFVDQFRTLDGWMLVVVGIAIVTGSGNPPRRSAIGGLIVLVTVLISGYFLVFVITPLDLKYHLATAADRLAVQLQPIMVFVLFFALPTRLEKQP